MSLCFKWQKGLNIIRKWKEYKHEYLPGKIQVSKITEHFNGFLLAITDSK